MKKEKILVTGGAGYIGSHTLLELKKQGFEVLVYDNLSKGHQEATLGLPLVVADILDKARAYETLKKFKPDTVIHFVALTEVGESIKEPAQYFRTNVFGTLTFLEAMIEAGVKNFIFSSSAAVYGNPVRVPIKEEDTTNPVNPYGETKLTVERILADFERAYGLKFVSLRYFNAAGADPEGRLGEDHEPASHLIPRVLSVALGKMPQIEIFGTDYPTKDGTAIRDYIHVTDLAEAHILALKELLEKGKSRIYNLGNGNGFSVKEVIEVCRKVTGHPIPAKEVPRRAGDPAILVADATKAKKELGWQPRFFDLETIVKTAWQWYHSHPNGFSG